MDKNIEQKEHEKINKEKAVKNSNCRNGQRHRI